MRGGPTGRSGSWGRRVTSGAGPRSWDASGARSPPRGGGGRRDPSPSRRDIQDRPNPARHGPIPDGDHSEPHEKPVEISEESQKTPCESPSRRGGKEVVRAGAGGSGVGPASGRDRGYAV